MKKNEKPNYGITALKEFIIIGVIGIVGLLIFLIGLLQNGILKYIMIIPGGIIGFFGVYLPLVYILIRPVIFSDNPKRDFILWAINQGEIKGNEKILDVGCGRGAYADDPILLRKNLRILKGKAARIIGIDVDPGAERIHSWMNFDSLMGTLGRLRMMRSISSFATQC